MGVNNRQRRASKARKRDKEQARRREAQGWRDGPHEPPPSPREQVRALIEVAARAAVDDDPELMERAVARLVAADARLVGIESAGALLTRVGLLWSNGWQPAEVIRHAHRFDALSGRLVAAVVAADHARRDRATLHPRWAAQIEELDVPPTPDPTGWLPAFAGRELLDRRGLIAAVAHVIAILSDVGPLPTIVPPPGSGGVDAAMIATAVVDDPVLVKVRALLAQAESTTFQAEAETFTAKAQALMARHAIDAAVVWATTGRDERPVSIRLPIDDPYADIKSLLLQCVAARSRCRTVFHSRYGLQSIIGFASDVTATEVLYTSLLVQSQAFLQAEAAKALPGGRTRSRSFRASFLLSFTRRIDERLAEINAAVEAATDQPSAVPALVDRGCVVDDEVASVFGPLTSNVVRGGSDSVGWVRGRMAADLARLNAGEFEDGVDAPEPPAIERSA